MKVIKLTEGFEKIDDILMTNSEFDVKKLLENKPKIYRIVWDRNTDTYFVADAYVYIHHQIIEKAFKKGGYAGELLKHEDGLCNYLANLADSLQYVWRKIADYCNAGFYGSDIDPRNGICEEIDPFLLYLVYIPDGEDFYNSTEEDVEIPMKELPGTLLSRADSLKYFKDCGLLKLLRK